MDLSYWELKNWFANVDYTIVGSGIVGLHAALRLRERFPSSKILILEKGALPQGASTKNAGFACFGSLSEIIDDLKSHSEQDVVSLVEKRWRGLQLLRTRIGDKVMDFHFYGGSELFQQGDEQIFDECAAGMKHVNDLLWPIFGEDVFVSDRNRFGFRNVSPNTFFTRFEGQIDTGNMMQELLRQAVNVGILILNRQSVASFSDLGEAVEVHLESVSFKTRKLIVATNGFAARLVPLDVKPARAQVLITSPVLNRNLKGNFHLDRGYYYFRNVRNRILLGGGRNLDFQGETTDEFGPNEIIREKLHQMLNDVILPDADFSIEHSWSGIMGMGTQKQPIISQLSDNVYCGVRLGGMGVAIGSVVGTEVADLI